MYMISKLLVRKGSRIALLVLQVVIMLLCAGYIEYVYYTDIYPERQVKRVFTQTDCTIINKRMSEKSTVIPKFRADFLISYNVNSVQYNRWVSGSGLEMLYTSDKSSQDKLLERFEIGGTYSCWFNPMLPQVSVLVVKSGWGPALPLFIPLAIALLALYFFLRTALHFPVVAKLKSRVQSKKKPKKK
jgi:hypothetical protein